jgi:hypothetical protein
MALTRLAAPLALVFVLAALAGASPRGALAGGPVVNSADDSNDGTCDPAHCSFREGLLALVAGDTLSFAIPGDGPHVIQPGTQLPAIAADNVTINGYSQAGAEPNSAASWQPGNADLRIVIDGSLIAEEDVGGLWIHGHGVAVRGLVIQNFPGDGVFIATSGSAIVQGNYIGTDVTGMAAAGNGANGVYIYSGQAGNFIGGGNPDQRNVISGNGTNGIEMLGGTALIANGNFIGTNAAGTAAIPNGKSGIDMRDGPMSDIGSAVEGTGNVISGNMEHGVLLRGLGSNNILVKNSRIGTAADGETAVPNGMHGVYLDQGAHDNTLGGLAPSNWNTIAYNGGAGVALSASAGANNYIDPNVIYANEGLGIDLKVDGVTDNDLNDPDSGPNDLQNFPVITRADWAGGVLTVEGTLNSEPDHFFPIFVFASSECDPSGYGEGERFLGETFAGGGAPDHLWDDQFTAAVFAGDVITVTASNPESTSEFSECFPVSGAPLPELRWGDWNCSMSPPDPVDSLLTLRHDAGLGANTGSCPDFGEEVDVALASVHTWGDADCMGGVSPVDSLKILRFDAGLNVVQAQGCPPLGALIEIAAP